MVLKAIVKFSKWNLDTVDATMDRNRFIVAVFF